jgi:orotidine-5'-phosphate decarboxylase
MMGDPMTPNSFKDKLMAAATRNRSLLCVGLDADPALMPVRDVFEFNRGIIEATKDLVCAYKPNLGFYDGLGEDGHRALRQTLDFIRANTHVPIIGDAKRGDVQPTAGLYARSMFDVWGFDAATVNPYGGSDAVQPFLDYADRGVFVWCRSSNAGARELQDLLTTSPLGGDTRPFYQWVAVRASAWNTAGNVGLVVGATYPDELRQVRELCPDMLVLVPGIGAQGGGLEQAVGAGVDGRGRGVVIAASRSVLYASRDPGTYEEAAHREARALRDRINVVLEALGFGWTG